MKSYDYYRYGPDPGVGSEYQTDVCSGYQAGEGSYLDAQLIDDNTPYLEEKPFNQLDCCDSIFGGKVEDIGKRLRRLNGKIEERLKIKEKNLESLFQDELKFSTYLTQLKDTRSYFIDNSRRNFLEDKLNRFNLERRLEEVSCFRDMLLLERELNETIKEYYEAKQKKRILEDDQGAKRYM